jgi:hypothetical protein
MAVPLGSHTCFKTHPFECCFSRKHKDFVFLVIEQKELKVHASYEVNYRSLRFFLVFAISLFLIGY